MHEVGAPGNHNFVSKNSKAVPTVLAKITAWPLPLDRGLNGHHVEKDEVEKDEFQQTRVSNGADYSFRILTPGNCRWGAISSAHSVYCHDPR